MALTSEKWKAFQFFDASEVSLEDEKCRNLFVDGQASALCSGAGNIYVADHDGIVHVISKTFKIVQSFKTHETGSVTHMKRVDGTSLLLTISEDMSNEPELKVWALDKIDKKTGIPRCLSTLTIQNQRRSFPLSAFAVVNDISQLAFGFANGAVTLVRGDLIHDRGARQRKIFKSEEPITAIEFREGKTTALYIATTARILTLIVSGRGSGQPVRTIDEKGCAIGCMALDSATRDVVVARDDAIYYYSLHARGAYYNCDGSKTMMRTFKDYVAIAFLSATSAISRSTLATFNADRDDRTGSSTVVLLNPDFSFIAHTQNLASPIKHAWNEWGEFFVLTLDGKVHRYREKPLADRFEMLFQRTDYVLAIQIAQKVGVDKRQQNLIFRKYGDYLYQKKDYDTAMQQYLRAIDNTEPSQIIRKYLDTQRIFNLIDYLEELHEHDKANSDHTTLLLNCYAKLKDTEKLESFIKAPGNDKFDLDTAIAMCRQGGYFDQAAYLARKHLEHDLVVSILVEDSKLYAEAVAYIWRLDPQTAFSNMSRYATVLLEHCSADTTQMFIDYYTGKFRPKQDAIVETETSVEPQEDRPGFARQATSAVQNLAAMIPLPYMPMSHEKSSNPEKKIEIRIVESTSNEPPPQYDIPRPRTAFAAFIDHAMEFIRFLEACLDYGEFNQEDKVDIYTTLFEMYLRSANEAKGETKTQWEKKAKDLIEGKDIPIDIANVLLLSHLEHFRDGTILVREQQGLRFDIFRSYSTANDTAGVIKAVNKYGPEEPALYPAALAYFTSNQRALEEAGDEVEKVLRKIDEDGLMAPLQVIQTLSTNDVATMGLVKKYLSDSIGRERQEISSNRKTILAYREDTEKKQASFDALTKQPVVFDKARCKSCGYQLDQPTVHFMCEHSFHQRCLNIGEGESVETVECPACAPQNANIRAIKRAQQEHKGRHDLFKDELARSKDGFETVAKWFGRGVMTVGPNE